MKNISASGLLTAIIYFVAIALISFAATYFLTTFVVVPLLDFLFGGCAQMSSDACMLGNPHEWQALFASPFIFILIGGTIIKLTSKRFLKK
jgi:hypothetical protein